MFTRLPPDIKAKTPKPLEINARIPTERGQDLALRAELIDRVAAMCQKATYVIVVIVFGLVWTTHATAQWDSSGLKVSGSVDVVGSFKGNQFSTAPDRLDVREAELMLYGPIDHLFDGQLTLAAHPELGASVFEIHEAYVASSRLLPRTKFRIGQYFLGLGRLNHFHRHEWPFVSAPMIHAKLFGDEGVIDTGGEVAWIAPLPFYMDVTAGIANGWVFGHTHDAGAKPRQPTHYTRLGSYSDLPFDGGIQWGSTLLRRMDAWGGSTMIFGIDATAKWREGTYLKWLVQSEYWHRTQRIKQMDSDLGPEEALQGTYVLVQHGVSQVWDVGLRGDWYGIPTMRDAFGSSLRYNEYGMTPTLTWHPSEFSIWRVAGTYQVTRTESATDAWRDRPRLGFEVQTTFNFGAHPAHEF